MRTIPNRAAALHGDILILECDIEELPVLAENLEVDMTTANLHYRERLLRAGTHEQQSGRQAQAEERLDDNNAMDDAIGKLRKKIRCYEPGN